MSRLKEQLQERYVVLTWLIKNRIKAARVANTVGKEVIVAAVRADRFYRSNWQLFARGLIMAHSGDTIVSRQIRGDNIEVDTHNIARTRSQCTHRMRVGCCDTWLQHAASGLPQV
jgi:hypothetical protein